MGPWARTGALLLQNRWGTPAPAPALWAPDQAPPRDPPQSTAVSHQRAQRVALGDPGPESACQMASLPQRPLSARGQHLSSPPHFVPRNETCLPGASRAPGLLTTTVPATSPEERHFNDQESPFPKESAKPTPYWTGKGPALEPLWASSQSLSKSLHVLICTEGPGAQTRQHCCEGSTENARGAPTALSDLVLVPRGRRL